MPTNGTISPTSWMRVRMRICDNSMKRKLTKSNWWKRQSTDRALKDTVMKRNRRKSNWAARQEKLGRQKGSRTKKRLAEAQRQKGGTGAFPAPIPAGGQQKMLGKPKESRHGTMPPPRPWPGPERWCVVRGGRWAVGGGRCRRLASQLAAHNSWPASVQFEACLLPQQKKVQAKNKSGNEQLAADWNNCSGGISHQRR